MIPLLLATDAVQRRREEGEEQAGMYLTLTLSTHHTLEICVYSEHTLNCVYLYIYMCVYYIYVCINVYPVNLTMYIRVYQIPSE